MTDDDRKLLERAAKAAGYSIEWCQEYPGGGCYMKRVIPEPPEPYSKRVPWNPLQDDGDALRLAVALRLDIEHNSPVGQQRWVSAERLGIKGSFPPVIWVEDDFDEAARGAATRRAIVRAAAATVEGGA